jgi:hypothetical protein
MVRNETKRIRSQALTMINVRFFSFRRRPVMSWKRLLILRKSKQAGMVVDVDIVAVGSR